MRRLIAIFLASAGIIFLVALACSNPAKAQTEETPVIEEGGEDPIPPEEGFVPGLEPPGEQGPAVRTPPVELRPPGAAPGAEVGARAEGETRWAVKINAAIRAHYVFNDSQDNFVVKYRWEIKGQANANSAVIRGDADINADVEGTLAKWPTGECKLEVSIPKVPFDLTFQHNAEDKGNIALKFRRQITEDWQSKCTFTDAPGVRFDTRGEPEKLLARVIEKARPPLRSIVMNIGQEETSSTFIINKETIDDPPLGTIEIEGTGVITITPGGGA